MPGIETSGIRHTQEAWVKWLQPVFGDRGSVYFTGTYCDAYGHSHGLMLARNVEKDFRRFLGSIGHTKEWVCGVERHKDRDVLHLHGIIAGPYDEIGIDVMRNLWSGNWRGRRGWCKALPVTDGCESYVTKYALKGDSEYFTWGLGGEIAENDRAIARIARALGAEIDGERRSGDSRSGASDEPSRPSPQDNAPIHEQGKLWTPSGGFC